jgi:uncharacterized repeat protein (TIGR03837 family)
MRIDVFCRVVDNFGDAGVTWRLARQLAAEHGADVVLRIDVPQALARIADEEFAAGCTGSVEVRPLRDDEAAAPLPNLVIEGFGCGLPLPYLDAMAASRRPPVWVNLEYLSAEPWIESVHGLPSPHPRLALTRHFFFPGFTRATGGLPRERDLLAARAHARIAGAMASPRVAALRATVEQARGDGARVTTVSLFCYANRALPGLLDAWVEGDAPVLCIVPEGVAAPSFDAWLAGAVPHAGQTFTHGALTLATIPFVPQSEYDRLLWSCDFDFVRGEDSFVRAQWGAQPFIWHIYPQADDAHRVKLEAFLDRYLADAGAGLSAPTRAFWRAWNDGDAAGTAAAWPAFAAAAPALAAHNARWVERLATLPDLASSLVEFCRNRL